MEYDILKMGKKGVNWANNIQEYQHILKLQSATKWVETLRPKLFFFCVLLTSKGGNMAFLPHPLCAMLCPCSSCL